MLMAEIVRGVSCLSFKPSVVDKMGTAVNGLLNVNIDVNHKNETRTESTLCVLVQILRSPTV